ncbi:MAG TPA: acyl carrier protein [Tepidisphaeraceae bacterium]|nr:acyl carrier protein [Tepidisphaeraceae bacterium]
MTIELSIRQFITDNFLYRDPGASLADNESLLEKGLIDSTGILELVMFVEKTFSIQVADAEVIPENLDSIARIAAYIRRKQADSQISAA